uniref:Tctex1 domain containing 1 n=1 Tax=Varanus komodoensis TaxID=61221 RepID=A0A8D2IVW6_VARKO
MSDVLKDKATCFLKKRGSISSFGSHEVKAKEFLGKNKDSISTVPYMDEPGHHDDTLRPAVQMENTYQLIGKQNGSDFDSEVKSLGI